MNSARERDEFKRIHLNHRVERDRAMIAQYEEHQAFYRARIGDHEEFIAEVQQWADEAAAAGDTQGERWHLDHVARLKAMPYPWERDRLAA